MTRVVPLLAASALLSACMPSQTPVSGTPPAEVVSFAPIRVDRGGYCIVGFTVTYPEGIAPHARRVTLEEPALGVSNGYVLPIPPMGPPTAFTRQSGLVTFAGLGNATVTSCDPELTRRSLTVGACTEGTCAPARFLPDPTLAAFGLTGKVEE